MKPHLLLLLALLLPASATAAPPNPGRPPASLRLQPFPREYLYEPRTGWCLEWLIYETEIVTRKCRHDRPRARVRLAGH